MDLCCVLLDILSLLSCKLVNALSQLMSCSAVVNFSPIYYLFFKSLAMLLENRSIMRDNNSAEGRCKAKVSTAFFTSHLYITQQQNRIIPKSYNSVLAIQIVSQQLFLICMSSRRVLSESIL